MPGLVTFGISYDNKVKQLVSSLSLASIYIELNDVNTLKAIIQEIRKVNIWVFIAIIDNTIYNQLHETMLDLLREGASIVLPSQPTAVNFYNEYKSRFYLFNKNFKFNQLFFYKLVTFNAITSDEWKEILDFRLNLLKERNRLLIKKAAFAKQTPPKPLVDIRTLDRNQPKHIAEYNEAKDLFEKFAQKVGDFKVTQIQKVQNLDMKIRFIVCQAHLWKPSYKNYKFHGTDSNAIALISQQGFRFGGRNTGLFGGGIYFATDSFKSHAYTKNSNQMLICQVAIGKVLQAASHMQNALPESIKGKADSLFAPRKTGNVGIAPYDEWICWHPDQAYAKYIISYSTTK